MMKCGKKYWGSIVSKVFLIVICFASFHSYSQNEIEPSVKILARSFGDSVVLRWAPNTPASWLALNSHGYRIDRYTMVRDSVALKEKPMKILANGIKPSELAIWTPWAKDEMVAITAQAIYGKSFTLTNNKSTSIGDVINLSREQESRFSFALFACDISVRAATLAGLRWVDKEVKKNEKYLYRVYSLVPENELKINFGYVFVSASDILRPTPPRAPTIKFGDQIALIEWDANPLRDIYIAYFVERSEDGKSFKRISKRPIIPIVDGNGSLRISTKTDSLTSNEVEYYYRIQGLTPFGDEGPYSNLVKGRGISPIRERGFISDYVISKQGKILVRWKFPKDYEKEINGFNLERGTKVDGAYAGVSKKLIDPSQRNFEDPAPSSTNYYRLITLGKGNQKVVSHPYLIQLQDSIPPLPPGGLSAKIDTLGLVSLSWKVNTEADLAGYHIYRSNFASSEYARVSKNPITENSYQDTINLKTLTNKIYYKLTAIDNRFNPSDFSAVVKLVRPDVVPPVPPQIESIRSDLNGVKICWIRSSSEDVGIHRLFRKETISENWVEVKRFLNNDSTCFVDKPTTKNLRHYKIVAEDSAKHLASSTVVSAKIIENGIRPPIQNIKAQVDREAKQIKLSWEYNESNVVKYLIYRAEGDSPISLYSSVAGITSFTDSKLVMNTRYLYRAKAVFRDGVESLFSKALEVKF